MPTPIAELALQHITQLHRDNVRCPPVLLLRARQKHLLLPLQAMLEREEGVLALSWLPAYLGALAIPVDACAMILPMRLLIRDSEAETLAILAKYPDPSRLPDSLTQPHLMLFSYEGDSEKVQRIPLAVDLLSTGQPVDVSPNNNTFKGLLSKQQTLLRQLSEHDGRQEPVVVLRGIAKQHDQQQGSKAHQVALDLAQNILAQAPLYCPLQGNSTVH